MWCQSPMGNSFTDLLYQFVQCWDNNRKSAQKLGTSNPELIVYTSLYTKKKLVLNGEGDIWDIAWEIGLKAKSNAV